MAKSSTLKTEEVFASYYHKDVGENSFNAIEHALVYAARGNVDVMIDGRQIAAIKEGECIFVRKNHRVSLIKYPSKDVGYHVSVVLFFPRRQLFEFYKALPDEDLPQKKPSDKKSVFKIERSSMLTSIFDSFRPYWLSGDLPKKEWLEMKVVEAIRFLSLTDEGTYASLFDFTARWRLDILDFMEKNYMYELTIEELARYTGRSPATFKRDFKKLSDISPRNWIINRRLKAAHQRLLTTTLPINRIMTDVGFKNFSHFSKVYHKRYGITPTETRLLHEPHKTII